MKHQWFLRRWFIQGLIILLPGVVTAVVLYYGIIYADMALGFLWSLLPFTTANTFFFPGLGVLVVAALTILVGALTEWFVISKVVDIFNNLMSKVPIIRSIYSTVLKVAQNTLGNMENFSEVVLLEHNDKYCIAFKTSEASEVISNKLKQKMINVFLPTTPNPTSGFYIIVPENKTIPLDIEAEAAFKLIISAGIVKD